MNLNQKKPLWNFKKIFKILAVVLSVLYPVIVFVFLYFLKTPVRFLSIFIIIVAFGIFLSLTARKKDGQKTVLDARQIITPILLLTAGLLCLLTNKILFLKLYSVFLSGIFLFLFGSTLFFEPTIIFRFATLGDKSIIGSSYEDDVKKYCRTVTVIWCIFFVINGSLSTITAFSRDIFHITQEEADKVWTIYNGAISYVLMGLLFAVEFLVRKIYDGHLVKAFPLSNFKSYSRKESHVLCLAPDNKMKKTWGDFLSESEFLRKKMSSLPENKVTLDASDEWFLLTSLCAALQVGKLPVIDFENESAHQFLAKKDFYFAQIEKHSQPIPEIQSQNAIIEIHSRANLSQIPLSQIEDKINSIIQAEGKKLIQKKEPATIGKKDAEQFIQDLLLHFTLGLKFYGNFYKASCNEIKER